MNRSETVIGMIISVLAVLGLLGMLPVGPAAAGDVPHGFDANGEKIFTRYDETPLAAMTGTDGKRNLNSYYELRQYPGSPPRIPHAVAYTYSDGLGNCLACHGRGGYVEELGAYAPVTPHPEKEMCYQCHVPKRTDELFRENDWLSVPPPKLGNSQMAGSPPPIPHSLQLRDDCIACHTGPAAVAEIRVEHASRGNCRQCHVLYLRTEPAREFTRNK